MFLVLLVISLEVTGKNSGVPVKAHCDFPRLNNDDKLYLDLHYAADSTIEGYLELQYFKYQNDDDSKRIYFASFHFWAFTNSILDYENVAICNGSIFIFFNPMAFE